MTRMTDDPNRHAPFCPKSAARDILPADQAAATLCCAPGVAWLETRLDAASDATGRPA